MRDGRFSMGGSPYLGDLTDLMADVDEKEKEKETRILHGLFSWSIKKEMWK